ncbi:sulfatase-like hydrolase/transferase [Flavicella sp.]|uniref:sulfatase-like hydrolase/transferase n=1 Tax=Flavicella sp. TaxID=2957742 RepID=UPI0026146DB6|nr:sulfatase-like hydrolase/transferase [Flavicella sp.]MDG1803548.1 sulfatase-like hydrolase/transferase [Flavicella sp.]
MKLLKSIHLAVIVLLVTSACRSNATEKSNKSTPPNILVILCDDLGYADVGFNGSTDIITPEMDKLAVNGTIFTSAYVAHSFCGPSRAALMTGRYPHQVGAPFNLHSNSSESDADNMGVTTSEVFMPKALQEAGYYTSVIGKWHLGASPKFHPNKRGFDNFYGFLGGGHNYFPSKYRKVYESQKKQGVKIIRDYVFPLEHNGKEVRETEYITDALSRETVNTIKLAKKNKQPFFTYLAYNAPHVPLEAKTEDMEVFNSIKDKDRRTYAGMVYAVDRGVGEIVAALKETNQLENTIIVFLSDNGGNFDHGANNAPLKGTKGDTWEGGFRVPMFVHWPAKLKGGQIYDYPVSALDLYPSFLNAANAKLPKDKVLSGKDILPAVIAGEDARPNEMIYALRYRHGYCDVAGRKGSLKVTRMGNEPWLMFDVDKDKGEKKNLGKRYPEKMKDMIQEIEEWTHSFIKPMWYYSAKDEELWEDGRMPQFKETFEVDMLQNSASKR